MNPDFSDMLSAFTEERVEFMVVGAYALAVYGVPRATGSLDLWVRATPANAGRVMAALKRFGAPLEQISEPDFEKPDVVFQVGVAPRRIGLLTSIDGVAFDEAAPRCVKAKIGDLPIPVIGREDFVKNKRAVGRTKDLADISSLEEQD